MPESEKQTIETLQRRYEEFKSEKVKYETQRDSALSELAKLKQQALQKYGSDDLQQLEQQLEQIKQENESKRSQYQASLDRIEAELNSVKEQFDADVTTEPDHGG